MKKLTEPVNTGAENLLDKIISRKRDEDYKNSLTANKIYIVARYKNYNAEKARLEKIGVSAISKEEDKAAIHSAFNSSFKKNIKKSELAKIYEECQSVCPYCGDGKIEEIDHYIPKEHYPEFTLYPGNLIPLCNKCNKKKSDKFLDAGGKRQFIYFYCDKIDQYDFLDVEILYDSLDIKNSIKVKYTADYNKITDKYQREVVESHFYNLDLLNRFEEAAINEISELVMVLINQPERETGKLNTYVSMTIIGNMNTRLIQAGKNDWKYVLYRKMTKTRFMEDLVLYVSGHE